MRQWRTDYGNLACDTWTYKDPRHTWSSIRHGRKGIRIGTGITELCLYPDNYNHFGGKSTI